MATRTISDELMGRLNEVIRMGKFDRKRIVTLAVDLLLFGKDGERSGVPLTVTAALVFDLVINGHGAQRVATGAEYACATGPLTCSDVVDVRILETEGAG